MTDNKWANDMAEKFFKEIGFPQFCKQDDVPIFIKYILEAERRGFERGLTYAEEVTKLNNDCIRVLK